jgi:hypothetical protein
MHAAAVLSRPARLPRPRPLELGGRDERSPVWAEGNAREEQ